VISLRLLAFVNPKPDAKKAIALAALEAADSSPIEKIKSQFNGHSVRRRYFSHSALARLDDPISGAGGWRHSCFEAQEAAGLARPCRLNEKTGATT
jgi:hypothetical protein